MKYMPQIVVGNGGNGGPFIDMSFPEDILNNKVLGGVHLERSSWEQRKGFLRVYKLFCRAPN